MSMEDYEAALIQAVSELEAFDLQEALRTVLAACEEVKRTLPGIAGKLEAKALKAVRNYVDGKGSVDICQVCSKVLNDAIFSSDGQDPVLREFSLACMELARAACAPSSLELTYSIQNLASACWMHPQGLSGEKQGYDIMTEHLQRRLAELLRERADAAESNRTRISLLAH